MEKKNPTLLSAKKKALWDRKKKKILTTCTDKRGTIIVNPLAAMLQKEYKINTYDDLDIAVEILFQIEISDKIEKEIMDRLEHDIDQELKKRNRELDALEKERERKKFSLPITLSDQEKATILQSCTDKDGNIIIDFLVSKIQKDYPATTHRSLAIPDAVLLQLGIPAKIADEVYKRLEQAIDQEMEKERRRLDDLEKELTEKRKKP